MNQPKEPKTEERSHSSSSSKSYTIFISDMQNEINSNKANKFVHDLFFAYGKCKWCPSQNLDWVKVDLTNNKKPLDFTIGKNWLKSTRKTLHLFEKFVQLVTVKTPDFEDVDKHIIASDSLEEQLEIMEQMLFLSESDVEDRSRIADYIHCLLNFAGVKCNIATTGSTVTRLGLKNADLDIYVDVDGLSPPVSKPRAIEVLSGIHKILKKELRLFIPRPIPARCPIIKISFGQKFTSGISIDLSVSNVLATHNSSIFKAFLDELPHFKKLAALIKYWLIKCNFLGSNQITSYICLNLVLFFLQCHKLSPSLLDLQAHTPPFTVEGYNVAYDKDVFKSPVHKSSLSSIFLAFFNFYSKFPYSLQVISTNCGHSLSCQTVRAKYDWPATAMTIQDIIQLDANRGVNVADTFFDTFRASLKGINIFIQSQSPAAKKEDVSAKLYSLLISQAKPRQYFQLDNTKTHQSIRMPKLILDCVRLDDLIKIIHRWSLASVQSIEQVLQDILLISFTKLDFIGENSRVSRQSKLCEFTLALKDEDCDIINRRSSVIAWAKHSTSSAFVDCEKQAIQQLREKRQAQAAGDVDRELHLTFSLVVNLSSYSQISEIHFYDKKVVYTGPGSGKPPHDLLTLKRFISNYLLSFLSLVFAEEFSHELIK